MRFKIGDRVKIIPPANADTGWDDVEGKFGTIKNLATNPLEYLVKFDEIYYHGSMWFCEEDLEEVK
jgi:hypothetical protein